jgi:CRISPR-associated protein Cas1
MIQNPARLSLSKKQLTLENETGTTTLPVEDISVIILESPQISLTAALLSQCQENGVAVITCDEKHMPNGLMFPFLPHSRQSRVAHIQQSWTAPLRKRLWQTIVKQKISNQASCLDLAGQDSRPLTMLATRVQSGDAGNLEAQAARLYWPALFGKEFRRGKEDILNAALNYGYAIVRGYVARAQVSYGLLPAFGLHHCNQLNAFNLTDDAMEVLRPTVDRLVFSMVREGGLNDGHRLSKSDRQQLANIGNLTCRMDGQIQTLGTICERLAIGLVSAIEAKNAALLPLPELMP